MYWGAADYRRTLDELTDLLELRPLLKKPVSYSLLLSAATRATGSKNYEGGSPMVNPYLWGDRHGVAASF
jgi:hypothetical protein